MTQSRGRARLGLLVPFTNTNFEPDMALMVPPGVSLHVARMGGYDEDEIPDETQMQGLGESDLSEPLSLLMGVRPEVVLYGCTSATLTHGLAFDTALTARIHAQSGAQTVTAAGAVVAALAHLDVSRIGFASPYVPAINDLAIRFLEGAGVSTVARADIAGTLDNAGQGALTPDDVFELGMRADHPEADAILLSCTDMRAVETLDRLEKAVGKPVVSSNQALMFATLRALGIASPIEGYGCLLADSSPA